MRPLPKDRKEIQHASSVMMVGEKEFLKTLKVKNTPCFSILVKPKLEGKKKEGRLEERNVEPKEVRQLLDKYKEVILDYTTDTLPPFREVSHCIEFIPGSTLPNKPAYRLTLEQNK